MAKESDLEKQIKTLSNLKNYKGKSNDFIKKHAIINLKVREFKQDKLFEDPEKQKLAEKKFKNYLLTHEIESISDIDTLRSLVYIEVFESKIQQELNSIKVPSEKLTKQLLGVQDQKSALKIKLGIDRSEDEDTDLTKLQKLQKKMHTHIQFNKHEFTTMCAECCTPLLLRRRCDKENFDVLKHPMFAGRFYYNPRGIALVKEGKWTKEDYAWVFHTSTRFVDWCIEHEGDPIEIDKLSAEEIEKYIKDKWYLKDGFQESQITNKEK